LNGTGADERTGGLVSPGPTDFLKVDRLGGGGGVVAIIPSAARSAVRPRRLYFGQYYVNNNDCTAYGRNERALEQYYYRFAVSVYY